MPTENPKRSQRQLIWRIAGLWMVVLALGFAVIGIYFALQLAQSFTHKLMVRAQIDAADFASSTNSAFNRELTDAMAEVEHHCCSVQDKPWRKSQIIPTWIDGLYVWDGELLITLDQPADATNQLTTLIESRVSLRPLELRSEHDHQKIELLYDSLDNKPIVLAIMAINDRKNRVVFLIGHINKDRLKSDLVEPMLPADSGLEIVAVGEPHIKWFQPLYQAMRFWGIQPSKSFIDEQLNTVTGQTMSIIGLMLLALMTLLGAMWFVVRLAKRELALAEMKANFVADVSHELKTPLALIRMFGETLQSGRVQSEEKRNEYYEIITRESTRLTNLIDNILDFARIEAGKREYHLEPTDIGEVIEETYRSYRDQMERSGFEHHLSIEPNLPLVDADRDAISQVIVNLMNNAVKYSDDQRYIAIDVTSDTRRGRHGVLISVHDRGIGIKPEDRARLVDGFFRASDGRVRQQGGTGLGLALVKHIVEAHRGVIDVESRLVKGSTFRIFLPASQVVENGVDS